MFVFSLLHLSLGFIATWATIKVITKAPNDSTFNFAFKERELGWHYGKETSNYQKIIIPAFPPTPR